MSHESVTQTGEKLFALIDLKFGSDAAFERAANLPPKTVNNWRRGRSASFLKMLPELAELFGIPVRDLVDSTGGASPAQVLTAEEEEFLALFRSTGKLSERERAALTETIRSTVDLYLAARHGDGKK